MELNNFILDGMDYCPLYVPLIKKKQQENPTMSKWIESEKTKLTYYNARRLWINQAGQIWIPNSLQQHMLEFYHNNLTHPGITWMHKKMEAMIIWNGLKKDVIDFVKHCKTCQKWKRSTKKEGQLQPSKEVLLPWQQVNVDMIGPYQQDQTENLSTFYALTMIDLITKWFEVAPILKKKADTVAKSLNEYWLAKYPRPLWCRHNQGTEFPGIGFQEILASFGIEAKPVTRKTSKQME